MSITKRLQQPNYLLCALSALMLLVACLFFACPQGAHAEGTADNLKYEVVNDEVVITGHADGISGAVAIPSEIDSHPVTSIASAAFKDCRNIKTVSIPSSVTNIGKSAFEGCTGMESIDLGSVKSIGAAAFRSCKVLGNVSIPTGVTSIEANTFETCINLKTVTIPLSVLSIGEKAFQSCSSLRSVDIPSSVTDIEKFAFANSGVTHLNIPSSITEIKEGTFEMCAELTSVDVPASVMRLGESAFFACTSLQTVSLPTSLTTVGDRVFDTCTSLRSINIPISVTSIGKGAFYGCSGLTSITIPSSVKSLREYAFLYCNDHIKVYYRGAQAGWDAITLGNQVLSGKAELIVARTIEEKAPTCTEPGNKTYYELDNIYYEDMFCTVPIADINTWALIPALGHTPVPVSGRAATCLKAGLTDGVECSVCGEVLTPQKAIPKLAHTFKVSSKDPATTKQDGEILQVCQVCRTKEPVKIPKIAKVTFATNSYTYDKKAKKPAVKVVDSSGKVISSANYTMKYPAGRKDIGTYTATVTFKNDYSGTAKAKFSIVPKGTKVAKLAAAKGGFTVRWAVQKAKMPKSRIDGYQVRYSTKASMKSAKTSKLVKGYKSTSLKVTKLSAKKKYYVQVRTCMKVNGKYLYSDWSKAKAVKTK